MELKPTYGNFQVTGTIYDFLKNKEGEIVNTGITTNGQPWKSIRISIQTTENNIITVELFGMAKDTVRASKREGTGKDTKYVNKDFAWDKRGNLPKDYSLSGLDAVTYTTDEEKQAKNNNITKVAYDAIDDIVEIFKSGDAVFIRGGLTFNEYNGDTRPRCSVQRILRADETKFEKEGNEPCSKFEQTVVVRSTKLEKEEKRLYIDALIVTDKNGNFVEKEFYVDIAEREKLAKNIKKLSEFTQIKLIGDIINEAIISETSEVEDDGWGEDKVMQKKVVEGYVSSLRVTMADPETIIDAAYNVSDFVKKDELSDELSDEEIGDLVDEEDEIFENDSLDDLGDKIEVEESEDDGWL